MSGSKQLHEAIPVISSFVYTCTGSMDTFWNPPFFNILSYSLIQRSTQAGRPHSRFLPYILGISLMVTISAMANDCPFPKLDMPLLMPFSYLCTVYNTIEYYYIDRLIS